MQVAHPTRPWPFSVVGSLNLAFPRIVNFINFYFTCVDYNMQLDTDAFSRRKSSR